MTLTSGKYNSKLQTGEWNYMSTEKVLLNNTISLPCPEGFHVMSEEERAKQNMLLQGPGFCLNNPDIHVTVSAAWRQIGRFPSLVLTASDIMKKMETQIRKPMQQFGYQMDGYLTRNLGRHKAEGFRYRYDVQGKGMYGEAFVIKEKDMLYYLYVYIRQEFLEAGLAAWENLLAEAE